MPSDFKYNFGRRDTLLDSGRTYWDSIASALDTLGPGYDHIVKQVENLMQQRYSPTWGDNIAMDFGDSSAWDNFYRKNAQDAMELITRAKEAQRKQEYESAPAQAARMRAAGQNTDLTGGVEPGAAGELGEDQLPAQDQTNVTNGNQLALGLADTVFKIGSGLGSGVGSILSGAIGLMDAIQTIKGKKITNTWQDIKGFFDTLQGAPELIASLEKSGITPEQFLGVDVDTSPGSGVSELGAVMGSIQASGITDKRKPKPDPIYEAAEEALTPDALKAFQSIRKTLNPQTLAVGTAMRKKQAEFMGHGKTIAELSATPGYSESLTDFVTNYNASYGQYYREALEAMVKRDKAIADYEAKLHDPSMAESAYAATAAEFESEEEYSKYKRDYYEKADAKAAAEAANNESGAKVVQAQEAKAAATIAKAKFDHYARCIQSVIDDPRMDDNQKQELIQSIVTEANNYAAELEEAHTKAGKVLGQTDYLNAAINGLGNLDKIVEHWLNPNGKGKVKPKPKAGKHN